jgi:hypothetical protein
MGDAVFSTDDDECGCASCASNEALREHQKMNYDGVDKKTEFYEETQYLICPPRVLGYHLGFRTWLELDISEKSPDSNKQYLQDIAKPKSDEAFAKLELDPQVKTLIKDLVQCHTSTTIKKPLMEDIIKEKGRGLVILLHGMCAVSFVFDNAKVTVEIRSSRGWENIDSGYVFFSGPLWL